MEGEETREIDFIDVDGDGDLDVYIANVAFRAQAPEGAPDRLLINYGSGQFTDESAERLPDWTGHSIDVDGADIDGDGVVELVLGVELAGTSAPQNIYGLMMDESFRAKNGPKQYYVDGKMYESWDDIPKSYKLDLPENNMPTEEDAKVKLKF